jgi:hypothetical protein
LDAQPTLYLDEIQTRLSNDQGVDVSLATVSHALRHLALANKNVVKEALEWDDILRATWMADVGLYEANQFVFLDEAGVDDHTGEWR